MSIYFFFLLSLRVFLLLLFLFLSLLFLLFSCCCFLWYFTCSCSCSLFHSHSRTFKRMVTDMPESFNIRLLTLVAHIPLSYRNNYQTWRLLCAHLSLHVNTRWVILFSGPGSSRGGREWLRLIANTCTETFEVAWAVWEVCWRVRGWNDKAFRKVTMRVGGQRGRRVAVIRVESVKVLNKNVMSKGIERAANP